jgi:hypothetical protein
MNGFSAMLWPFHDIVFFLVGSGIFYESVKRDKGEKE